MKTTERNAEMYSNDCHADAVKAALNAASPKKQSESAYAAQVLEQFLDETNTLILELTRRLQPVLENRPQKAEEVGIEKAERQMFSPIGQGLMDTAHRIDRMNISLAALIETLAV